MLKNCAYKITVVLVLGAILIITVINAFYFFRLKNGKSLGSFELNSMYWTSVILSIILVIMFSWGIYQAVVTCGVDKTVKENYQYYKKGKEISRMVEE